MSLKMEYSEFSKYPAWQHVVERAKNIHKKDGAGRTKKLLEELKEIEARAVELREQIKKKCPHPLMGIRVETWGHTDDYGCYIPGSNYNLICGLCSRTIDYWSTDH